MTTETSTPRTDSQETTGDRMQFSDVVSAVFARQLERELNAAILDTKRLDALESIPHAMSISCDINQPKADSVPSLRSQIDYFLEKRAAAMPNDES